MKFFRDLVWVLPISTKKFEDRRNSIKNTWGKRLPVTFYSDHQENNCIEVSKRDDYSSAVEKTLNVVRILQSQKEKKVQRIMKSRWIFFVDDDTWINPDNLKKKLKTLDKQNVYGELHDYTIQAANGNYAVDQVLSLIPNLNWGLHGGAGFLIAPENLMKLNVEKYPNIEIQNGDVAFSILTHLAGLQMVNLDGLNWNNREFYGGAKVIHNEITFHYVKPLVMENYWKELSPKFKLNHFRN